MREVTRGDLGAWLLKCNPKSWDLERFLADGHEVVHSWVVQDNYRSTKLMEKDDPVALWVTGDGKYAGVLGVGQVTGPVGPRVPGHEYEEAYWVPSGKPPSTASLWVPIEVGLVHKALSRSAVQGDPELEKAEVFAAPQQGNPNVLDRPQWAALQGMFRRHLLLLGKP